MHILIFLGILAIGKFIFSMNMDLSPDETYYWEWSRHLEMSYYDQGPGVALYIRFFTMLFGNTLFALKLAAVFSYIICLFLIFKISTELSFSKQQQFFTLGMMSLMPGFFFGSMYIMHDSALLIGWVLALYFFVLYVKRKKPVYLYLLFLACGLGFLSKHTMLFFGISLILWIVITPIEWTVFSKKHIYLSVLLGLVVVSPMILWNIQNNWENLDAILHLRSAGTGENNNASVDKFFVAQALLFSPLWWFTFVISVYRLKHTIISQEPSDTILKFLWINSMILPIFFFFMSLKKQTQPNWVFPSYPAAILLVGYMLGEPKELLKNQLLKQLVIYGFVVSISLNFVSMFLYEIKNFLGIKINSYYTSARFKGYKEVIREVEVFQKEKHPSSILITNRYQDASIGSWYIQGQPHVNSINILFKNQYNHWNQMELGKDYLIYYIQENSCEKPLTMFDIVLSDMFDELTTYPEKEIVINGEVLKRYQVWYGKGYKKAWEDAFFEPLNSSLWFAYSGGMYSVTNPDKYKENQSKIFQSIRSYLSSSGEVKCKVFQ
jgi:hypothetical protein